ncbi:MAG TPA: acyl-CoA dehydrogenase family protein [Acidimicrobiales bacterium]|nr:acyl-CoA dehydrogenase family protein [Acidimicrobiales bacterium]
MPIDEPRPGPDRTEQLPFSTPEKARRYDTSRYLGATGLNWWSCDPTLQLTTQWLMEPPALEWARPRLERLGEIIGGPVSERAEETDRHPPRLERYDRWGHDVSRVVMPATFEDSKRDLLDNGFALPSVRDEAARAGVDLSVPSAAYSYMLDQAEIGMACALGTGGDMVHRLVERYAPDDVKERVLPKLASGEWLGDTAQSLTERTGGSDLAAIETTATPDGDAWRLNGFKWFVSNANGHAWVVLAKPEGAPDTSRGICNFLVLTERRDGTRNGIRIRRLKDKLGTKAVASAEVEFVDAEAFLLADPASAAGPDSAGDGRGLARMMDLTNGARLGIAMMGLGCARRALVESLLYASARDAFGKALRDQPLMQRKLAELIVEVEAAQALVFDGWTRRLRLTAPLAKLRASRLGITAASDAIEIHGGNGYCETWPVARLLRDAQVNPIWEGPDNILCLDVRRAIQRESAHVPLLDHIRRAASRGPEGDPTVGVVERAADDLEAAVAAWSRLDPVTGEARLFTLSQLMCDVLSAALLVEQAGFEARQAGTDRKAVVARLYARDHLGERGRLRGLDDERAEDLERFKDLWDGALVDGRN